LLNKGKVILTQSKTFTNLEESNGPTGTTPTMKILATVPQREAKRSRRSVVGGHIFTGVLDVTEFGDNVIIRYYGGIGPY
jgi:hypothetical protein